MGRPRGSCRATPAGCRAAQDNTSAYTYDNALAIDAYLAEGTAGGRARAEVLGRGLLSLQAHDPARDGRLRDAYAPAPPGAPGDARATDPASTTGALAWAGQALVQLYAATGARAYLHGAIMLGDWIQSRTRSPDDDGDGDGNGGYSGGDTASGAAIPWKLTEHNIDVFAFFRLLARETGDRVWAARAAWARRFIVAMWDGAQGRFYLGSTDNGVTPNNTAQVEDVNSWSYLALRDPAYAGSVDWDVENLGVSAGGYTGVSICTGDRTGVWFEGTAHLADALEFQGQPGDIAQAAAYLAGIAYAQVNGPNADGRGIMAASQDALADCEGDYVYASLSTGTTAWYILASDGIDPLSGTPVPSQLSADGRS